MKPQQTQFTPFASKQRSSSQSPWSTTPRTSCPRPVPMLTSLDHSATCPRRNWAYSAIPLATSSSSHRAVLTGGTSPLTTSGTRHTSHPRSSTTYGLSWTTWSVTSSRRPRRPPPVLVKPEKERPQRRSSGTLWTSGFRSSPVSVAPSTGCGSFGSSASLRCSASKWWRWTSAVWWPQPTRAAMETRYGGRTRWSCCSRTAVVERSINAGKWRKQNPFIACWFWRAGCVARLFRI